MNNYCWFYDRYGSPQIILTSEGKYIDRHGYNLGYIEDNLIYTYSGNHVGWIEGYVIRDLKGFTVGFSEFSNDYPTPIYPIPRIPPIPAIPQISPIPAIKHIPHIKPIKQFGWSPVSLTNLFK